MGRGEIKGRFVVPKERDNGFSMGGNPNERTEKNGGKKQLGWVEIKRVEKKRKGKANLLGKKGGGCGPVPQGLKPKQLTSS